MRALRPVLSALPVVLALAALVGCADNFGKPDSGGSQQPQGAQLRITLGTQAFPEARILGELWRQALAANGYTVDLRKAVGPAAKLDELLKAERIDGYVAYTGTVLSVVAHQPVSGLGPQETYRRAKAFYAGRGMVMSAMTPFQNVDAIATTRAFAQEHGLQSIGDLRRLAHLRLGARPEFQDLHLGLGGLKQVYGLTKVRFQPTELGRQYAALDRGDVDAVNAFSTDPQLQGGEYQVLRDPKLLFGSQNVVMTVGADELERVGAQRFMDVVNGVNRRLTQPDIVQMNAEVTNGEDEADVAQAFLRQHGLLGS